MNADDLRSAVKILPDLLVTLNQTSEVLTGNSLTGSPSTPSLSSEGSLPRSEVEIEPVPLIASPLGWPLWVKNLALLQIVLHATMASWCAAAFIPASDEMSDVFDKSMDNIMYLVGAYTLTMGFGALIWNSLADGLGRRPTMLISLVITIGATCGAAKPPTYATLMVARVFQGFGICAPNSLGADYIKDMYTPKDRGKALGLWTLGTTAGPYIGPFVSGFIAQHLDYEWVIWTEAIIIASVFILELFFLPESLISAPCYCSILGVRDLFFQIPRFSALRLEEPLLASVIETEENILAKINSFKQTLISVLFPAVWLCGLAFAIPYGYVSVGITSLFPTVYGDDYGFDDTAQSLLYLPMLIGSTLAESATGQLGDRLVASPHNNNFITSWISKRHSGDLDEIVPEMRLLIAILGILLSVAGLIWFGTSVDGHLHWANPAVASGVAALGLQMVTSICFSYVIDCYPKAAKEVSTTMNLLRSFSSFAVLFYNDKLDNTVGYGWSFGIQAFLSGSFGIGGLCLLFLFGGRWRS